MRSQAWIRAVVVIAGIAASLSAGQTREPLPKAGFATLTGPTSVPFGWVDFCGRYDGECAGDAGPAEDILLTAKAFRDIEDINRAVNKNVKAQTDMDHWGVVDRWDYPLDGRGDCEDYALLKRKMLMDAGYPRQALLMTVVKDHEGEGHAVLTVKTSRGEFVLDNMTDAVLAWDLTGYRFVKRQSQADANRWLSIGAPVAAPLYTSQR